jgi:hypothetical protein
MKHIKIYEDYMNEGKYELDYNEGSKPDSVLVTNSEDDQELAEIDSKGKITWLAKGLPLSVKKNIEAAAEYHVDTLSESADSQKLAPKISKAIIEIDDSMSYVDFAQAVAQVLVDDYGKQNYEGFITELKKNLK